MSKSANCGMVRVWDPLIRIGHWLLVAGFTVAYLTEDEAADLHVLAGYLVAGVVLWRIVWGFIGPRRARFTDFAYGPAAALSYLKHLFRGNARRYVGHSPAGGLMVILLLASLASTTAAGLVLYAYEDNAGPLAGFVAASPSDLSFERFGIFTKAYANGDGDDHDRQEDANEGEELWEELHEFLANFTLFLVVLHIGGVALSSLAHRENLVHAMITGYKRAEGS